MNDPVQHPVIVRVVRYGLPLVILVFYLTAVRRFDYTPDSTFSSAIVAQNLVTWGAFALPPTLQGWTTPSPLWALLQLAGHRASIDLILFAKVFGLLFSCMALILAYLVAFEVLDDRLLAFCASFVIAMQAWFLYLAPTGSALPLAVALTLGYAFFLLRNDYALAALFAGIASLVFWEGAILFVLVLVDLMVNSVHRDRALRTAGVCVLAFAVVVSPWLIICVRRHIPVIPAMVPLGNVPDFGLLATGAVALTGILAVAGVVLSIRYGEGWVHVRTHGALIVWTALMLAFGIAGIWELLVLGVPFLVIGAFVGIQRGMQALRRSEGPYLVAFGFAVVMLLVNQVSFHRNAAPPIAEARDASRECAEIGVWMRAHIGDTVLIASDRPGEVGYRSGMYVVPPGEGAGPPADFLVTAVDTIPDYVTAYRPPTDELATSREHHVAVWQRRMH